MRSRLGTLLVREGLLNPMQHLTASEQAEDLDQPLIIALLDLGYVSEDRLVELVRKQLLVPVATPEMLTSPPPGALAAVPPEMARQFLFCPCGEDPQGNLLLAMADATDGHAMDEVTYHSGRRVVRYTATVSAIRWAIGHHYGLDLGQPAPPWDAVPTEEIVLLTKVKVPGRPARTPPPGDDSPSRTLHGQGPVLPPAPPQGSPPSGPRRPPMAPEAIRQPSGPAVTALPGEDQSEAGIGRKRRGTLLGLPQHELPHIADSSAYSGARTPSGELPSLKAKLGGPRAEAELAGSSRGPEVRGESGRIGLWSSSQESGDPLLRSEAFGQAVASVKRAKDRDEIGRALLRYLEAFFFNVAFLVVKQQRLVGWNGSGSQLQPERVPRIDVSLSERSTLRDVVSSRLIHQGSLGTAPADAALPVQLGYRPESVCLAPVLVRQKVIGVLYADGAHTRLVPGELEALLAEAGKAYETAILALK